MFILLFILKLIKIIYHRKELALKYTCLIFLMAGRFNAVSKKRFQNITCQQLESCAAATMACLIPDLTTFTIHWG